MDINQEIFGIEKPKNVCFFIFVVTKPQILFQNSMTIFWRIVLRYYTFFRSKNRDLETRPEFLTFSAKTHNRL